MVGEVPGWIEIGQRLRWAYCHIPSYRVLLALLRWLRQIQRDELEDNPPDSNTGGVLKALFDILRTEGDDAAIRALSIQTSRDMYRALELAAVMGSPHASSKDEETTQAYMDWTEKTMINTMSGNNNNTTTAAATQEQQQRSSGVLNPLPSRRLLVKEGALMQLSCSNNSNKESSMLSDDEKAWLGYLTGDISSLLQCKDKWLNSNDNIGRSSSLVTAGTVDGSRRVKGQGRVRANTSVSWAMDRGKDNRQVTQRQHHPLQWVKLHCLKEWCTELILEGAYNNNDNIMIKEIESRFNNAIRENLLHIISDDHNDGIFNKINECWINAMTLYDAEQSKSASKLSFKHLIQPMTIIWDWLNEDSQQQQQQGDSSDITTRQRRYQLFTTAEFGGYLSTLYRQEILPYHVKWCNEYNDEDYIDDNVDALLNGLIRAKLEVDDDYKYDDQLPASVIDEALVSALVANEQLHNNNNNHYHGVRQYKGNDAVSSTPTNPISPSILQSLFHILYTLAIIVANKVVDELEPKDSIQILREVVALCAELSPDDDTLKAESGPTSIELDTGVSSSQSTPAELIGTIALVRAWWMGYYKHEMHDDDDDDDDVGVEGNVDADIITALSTIKESACLVYPLLELFILDQKVSSDILTLYLQDKATPAFWTSMAKTQREISSIRDAGNTKGRDRSCRGRRRNSLTDADVNDMLSVYESLDSIVWLQSLVQDAILHQRHLKVLQEAPQPATENEIFAAQSLNIKDGKHKQQQGEDEGVLPLEVRRRMADARRHYERLQNCEEESRNKIIESLRNRVMDEDTFLPTLRKSHQGRLQLGYCAWVAIEIGLSVDEDNIIIDELIHVWLPQSTWLESSLPSEVTSQLKDLDSRLGS
ncbi:hypothetical protein FOL47_002459 [Perkinsus chesapeaki]|uniref:Uncharacterized protein n=1 Tax=Perkinsus chesapeaki TaxID=330153 RepID=A0A7J6MDG9_PERCH|nr:hypothetical protein FOL47_002459 [Perkinsus chesapeaki]